MLAAVHPSWMMNPVCCRHEMTNLSYAVQKRLFLLQSDRESGKNSYKVIELLAQVVFVPENKILILIITPVYFYVLV